MARNTPTMNTSGMFTLVTPFAAASDLVYKVIAIRSFDDIYKLGVDVYSKYYKPMGLIDDGTGTGFNFASEVAQNANIITLMSEDGKIVYVPDTYIASYPKLDTIPYQQVVLSLSLGPLPTTLDVQPLLNEVKDLVSARYGIQNPIASIHAVTDSIAVTPSQHATITQVRLGNIQTVETPYTEMIKMQAQIIELKQTITALTQICTSNGYFN